MASDAHFVEQGQGGAERVDAQGVQTAFFEFFRVRTQGEIVVGKILRVHHTVPPDDGGTDFLHHFRGDVEPTQTFDAEQPFVTVGGEKIDAVLFHVHWEHTQALDGVDTEQDALSLAESTEAVQIVAETAGVFHRADGKNPRSFIHRRFDVLKQHAPLSRRDETRFNAVPLEVEPGIDVGRKFDVRHDHVVPRLPVQPVGDEEMPSEVFLTNATSLDSALISRAKRVSYGFDVLHPARIVRSTLEAGVGRERFDGFVHAQRKRCNTGVIEKDVVSSDGELAADAVWIQERGFHVSPE